MRAQNPSELTLTSRALGTIDEGRQTNVESHTLTDVGVGTATKSVPGSLLSRNNFAAEQASPT